MPTAIPNYRNKEGVLQQPGLGYIPGREEPASTATCWAFPPDGRLFAVAANNGVILGNLHGGQELACWLLDTDRNDLMTLQERLR